MRDTLKERSFIFLLFLPIIAITGWFSVFIWGASQIAIVNNENTKEKERIKRLRKENYIIALNKEENLCDYDKEFLSKHPDYFKIGYYQYQKDPNWHK